MRVESIRRIAYVASLVFLVGCESTASVDGDVFLAGGGEVIFRAAGQPVYFMPDPDSVRMSTTRLCESYVAARGPWLAYSDTAAPEHESLASFDKLMESRRLEHKRRGRLRDQLVVQIEKLASSARATATDINAHFQMDSLKAGRYLVLVVDPGNMIWLDTVSVVAGAQVHRSISRVYRDDNFCADPLIDGGDRKRFYHSIYQSRI
jgi:hypothetical protein